MRPSSASHKGRVQSTSGTHPLYADSIPTSTPTHSSEADSDDDMAPPAEHPIQRSTTLRNQTLVEAAGGLKDARSKAGHDDDADDDEENTSSPRFHDRIPHPQQSEENERSMNNSPLSTSSMNELQTLFSYISQYKPEIIDVEPVLFPFLPEYMPAIGDLEAMIKIPAPISDPIFQDLGLIILDEPAAKQSDPAVLHYQLKSQAKTSTQSVVHQIPSSDVQRLDAWIQSTVSPDWLKSMYSPKHMYPSIETLMEEWDIDLDIPDLETFDLSLEEKIKVICAILQIPLYPDKNGLIQGLHVLFELYGAFLNNQHFALQGSTMSDF